MKSPGRQGQKLPPEEKQTKIWVDNIQNNPFLSGNAE